MDHVPIKYELPSRRDMLLSLEAHCFLSSWTITIRCTCGCVQRRPLPELAQVRMKDLEKRTLGNLVRRLTCQECGQKPVSVVVEHPALNEREELVAAG